MLEKSQESNQTAQPFTVQDKAFKRFLIEIRRALITAVHAIEDYTNGK